MNSSRLDSTNFLNSSRIAGVALALASVALLTGCGATGNDSPTRNIRQVTDGKDFESGAIKVRDLQIVVNADGTGSLIGTFINSGTSADTLNSISIGSTPVKLSAEKIALNPNSPVIFGGPTANATGDISGVTLVAGNHAMVNITFGSTDAVSSNVLIKNA